MSTPESSNGWNEWSKYVLRELERLSEEFKHQQEHFNKSDIKNATLQALIKETTTNLDNFKSDFKQFLEKDFKTLNDTVTSMRISNAKQLGLGGVGGMLITGLFEVLKLIFSK